MRHYEVVAVIHPDQQGRIAAMIELYKKIVTDGGGVLHRLEDWGRRPLAYPIQNQHKAQYVLMNIECGDATLDKLRETFRFSDSIIRSLIIRRDEPITAPSPVMQQEKKREDGEPAAPGDGGDAESDADSAPKESAADGLLLAKIRDRVMSAARKRRTITYSDLRKAAAAGRTVNLFGLLDKISDESNADKSVLLSVLVMNDDSGGVPGKPFFEKAAKRWGKDVDPEDKESRRTFFIEECARVYEAYTAPAADSDKTAAANKPSAPAEPVKTESAESAEPAESAESGGDSGAADSAVSDSSPDKEKSQ